MRDELGLETTIPRPDSSDEWANTIQEYLFAGWFTRAENELKRSILQAHEWDELRHDRFHEARLWQSHRFELLAHVYHVQRKWVQEKEVLIEAISIQENFGQEDRVSELLVQLAVALITLGEDFEPCWGRAIGNWRYKNNYHAAAEACDNIGDAYLEIGDFVRALGWYHRGLSYRTGEPRWNKELRANDGSTWSVALADRWQRGLSYLHLGRFWMEVGRITDAIQNLEQAVPLFAEGVQLDGYRLRTHLLLARAYRLNQLPQKAMQTYNSILTTFDTGSLVGHSVVREAIGANLIEQKQYEAAIPWLKEAKDYLDQYLKLKDSRALDTLHPHQAHLLLAQAYEALGRPTDALGAMEMAVSSISGYDQRTATAGVFREQALLLQRLGQKPRALSALTQAYTTTRTIDSVPDRIQVLQQIAESNADLDAPDGAQKVIDEAIRLYESLLPTITDPNQGFIFPAFASGKLYATSARLQIKRGQPRWDAVASLEQGRTRAIGFQLARKQRDPSAFLPPVEREDLRQARAAVEEAGRSYRLAQVNALEPANIDDVQDKPDLPAPERERRKRKRADLRKEQRDQLQALYDNAKHKYDQTLAAYGARFPLLGTATKPRPVSATEIQKHVQKRPDTLFVHFAVGQQRTDIYLITARGVTVRSLPLGEAALQSAITDWRSALTGRTIKERQPEHKVRMALSQQLLPILEEGLGPGIRRIVFLPDGPLYSLPFAALTDSKGRYLVERAALASAFTLVPPKALVARPPRPLRTAVCVGPPPLDITQAKRFPPLTHAQAEVQAVANLFPQHHVFLRQNTIETEIKRKLPSADVIHFATHALVESANGFRSSLLLSPDERLRDDGQLEAGEVLTLALKARLVLLSACDTGLGQPVSGEALLGFSWAFHIAGCDAVVGTLWPLVDRLAPPFVTALCQKVVAGATPEQALQAAQLASLRSDDPERRHPRHWAAFLLSTHH